VIYYTTNRAETQTAPKIYTSPIAVSATETIRATVVANGYSNSAIASAAYTINSPVQ